MFKKILLTTALMSGLLGAVEKTNFVELAPTKNSETKVDKVMYETDFMSAIESSNKSGKPIFFMISNENCPPCKMMKEGTLKDKKVIEALNKDFVSLILYTNKRDPMPRELFTGVTPTIWFLYPDATPIYQPLKGAMDRTNFLYSLATVVKTFKEQKSNANKEKTK